MTAKEKKALEDLFMQEVNLAMDDRPARHVARIAPKVAATLVEEGLIYPHIWRLGRDSFGIIEISGYCLTETGHFLYCTEIAEPEEEDEEE